MLFNRLFLPIEYRLAEWKAMSYPEALSGEILSCQREQHAYALKQTRARRTKKGIPVKLLCEKEQRRLSGEHAASQTLIKGRTSTIHEHWRFLTQGVLVSGKKKEESVHETSRNENRG